MNKWNVGLINVLLICSLLLGYSTAFAFSGTKSEDLEVSFEETTSCFALDLLVASGEGTLSAIVPQNCEGGYLAGTTVEIIAEPAFGSVIYYWKGSDFDITQKSLNQVTILKNSTVEIYFGIDNNILYAETPKSVSPNILRYWPDTQSYTIDVGTTIQFSIGAEDDDGDLKASEWIFNSSTEKWDQWLISPNYYSESTWSNTFSEPGEFYVFVYVYDDSNNESFIWWRITVINQRPTISLISPPTPINGSTINYDDVTFSWEDNDDDGIVQGYEYEVDGIGNSTGFNSVTINNMSIGDHTFRVRCYDDHSEYSEWDTTSFSINLASPPDLHTSIDALTEPWSWGFYVPFEISVINEGGIASGSFRVNLVASNDSVIGDSDDILIDYWNVNNLDPDNSWGLTWPTTLPMSPYSGMPENGIVYFGLHAIPVSGEVDIGDNTSYDPVDMTIETPLTPGSTFPKIIFKNTLNYPFIIDTEGDVTGDSVINYNMAIPNTSDDSWVANLVLPANIAPLPDATGVPLLIGDQGYLHGTYQAKLKTPDCSGDPPNTGIISGFFTYFRDGTDADQDTLPDNSEIDFEWFCEKPEIVYLSMWTDYYKDENLGTELFSRVTRIINLAEGSIIGTCYQTSFGGCEGENLSSPESNPVESLINKVPGYDSDLGDYSYDIDYDSSAAFYEYGFDWNSTGVRWWIVNPIDGLQKTLWDYRPLENTPEFERITTRPAKIIFNVWHAKNWLPPEDYWQPPVEPISYYIDWVQFTQSDSCAATVDALSSEKADCFLPAPDNLDSTTISSNLIDLTWSDNSSDELNFRIERSLDGVTGWEEIGSTPANNLIFTNTSLSSCTTYYYRVRAYRASDNTYSNYSNISHSTTSCPNQTLSVTKVGTGTVTSSPIGIDCGSNCSYNFPYNSTVILTANPTPGYTFSGWSGACSGTGMCTICMTSNKSVTATFDDTTGPSVTVTDPNGGETWYIGSSYGINWSATDNIDVDHVSIEYSINGGSTWSTITSSTNNDSYFSWTIPNSPTNLARVRVTAYDAAGNTGNDISNSNFTIAPSPDTTEPTVAVTSPNGGESWQANTVHNISWSATDNIGVSYVTLYYSINGGSTWLTIDSNEANDGSFSWTVPNNPTSTARVRVTAYDAAGNTGYDISNSNFTIAPSSDTTDPTVMVVAPNGGESWQANTVHNISWSATDNNGVSYVALYYSINGGSTWLTIDSNEANDGSFSWTVPNNPTSTARVRVTAYDAAGNSAYDISNSNFTITSNPPESFSKSSPSDGVTNLSTDPTLSWGASSGMSYYEYCLDTSNDNSCSNWVNNGTSTTKTLSGLSPGSTYYWHVRAVNSTGTTYSNENSTAFWNFTITINPPVSFNKSTPSNGAVILSTRPTISWAPSSGVGYYEYCLDTSNDNSCSNWVNNGTNTNKTLSGLSLGSTYYWHVRAVNSLGTTYSNASSIAFWNFSTTDGYKVYLPLLLKNFTPSLNHAPNQPVALNPQHLSENQPINLNLSWNASDPDGDNITYDVYFESMDNTPDILVANDISTKNFQLPTLSFSTTYYWQIKVTDEHGLTILGPIWSFTTIEESIPSGDMITIPAGNFQMGCDPVHNNGYSCAGIELPLHTVYLDEYQIDKYEVTNYQYGQCVTAGVCDPPEVNASTLRSSYFDNPIYSNYPVIEVSWYNAIDFCNWVGKRLPSEAEWEKAARGSSDTRVFPWGDESPTCSLVNYSSCVGDTDIVGNHPAGASSYGVMDMAGNVYEWVNDWYDSSYYEYSPSCNPPGPSSGTYKVLRGGYVTDNVYYLRVADRYYHLYPWERYSTNGFRCAADVP